MMFLVEGVMVVSTGVREMPVTRPAAIVTPGMPVCSSYTVLVEFLPVSIVKVPVVMAFAGLETAIRMPSAVPGFKLALKPVSRTLRPVVMQDKRPGSLYRLMVRAVQLGKPGIV